MHGCMQFGKTDEQETRLHRIDNLSPRFSTFQ